MPFLLLPAMAGLVLTAGGCNSSKMPESTTVANQVTAISGILAATELLVGENRFPFGLVKSDGTFGNYVV